MTGVFATNEIEQLLSQASAHQNVASLMTAHGLIPEFKNISLNLNLQTGLDFSGCNFENATLSGSWNGAYFNHNTFNFVNFEHANFSQATFQNVNFNQSHFEQTNLNQASFIDSNFSKSILQNCDLSDSSVYKTKFSDIVLSEPNLFNVLDLESNLEQVHLILKQNTHPCEYAMTGAFCHRVSPVISTTSDGYWAFAAHENLIAGGTEIRVIDNDSIFSQINSSVTSNELDLYKLMHEINDAIDIAVQDGNENLSIVQKILGFETPNIQIIKNLASDYVKNSDAIFIPGGENIIEGFYGGNHDFWSGMFTPKYYYAKQLIEFSLVDNALVAQKPIMGVCHGAQLINVYFGGTIKDVWGHFGITPELDIHTQEGVLGSLVQPGALGPSYHYQAIDQIGSGLEVVLSYKDVIKGVQLSNGFPLIMTQFHPEYYQDETSVNIMNGFLNMCSESAVQSKVIYLKDVLGIKDEFQAHVEVASQPPHSDSHFNTNDDFQEALMLMPMSMPLIEESTTINHC